jgi:alkylated DNA repair protein alkB family protein 1
MQHPLDPHQRPPEGIRGVYKRYQKMKPRDLDVDADIVDVVQHMRIVKHVGTEHLAQVFRNFLGEDAYQLSHDQEPSEIATYEHPDMPGMVCQSPNTLDLSKLHIPVTASS